MWNKFKKILVKKVLASGGKISIISRYSISNKCPQCNMDIQAAKNMRCK
jgi:hypothetical protein